MKIENDPTLKMHEKVQLKQNLIHSYDPGVISSNGNGNSMCALPGLQEALLGNMGHGGNNSQGVHVMRTTTMSPHAQSFYPPSETVESVIGEFFSVYLWVLN